MSEEVSKSKLRKSPGRPRKQEGRRLDNTLRLRLTKEEFIRVEEDASKMNISVSEYCRKAIFSTELIRPFSEEEVKLKRGLVGMANNLNQIAYQANAAGFESVKDTCRELLKKIKSELEKFRI